MTPRQLEILFREHSRGLVFFARKLVGEFNADDIVQDCFVKLSSLDIEDCEGINKLLYTMVLNGCKNFWKNKANSLSKFTHDEISEDYADAKIIQSQLINIIIYKIENLPPAERSVFDLLYIQQLKPNEASLILNISVSTVRTLKFRLDKDFKFWGVPLFPKKCWLNHRNRFELLPRLKKIKQI